jgi:hypothetical protein
MEEFDLERFGQRKLMPSDGKPIELRNIQQPCFRYGLDAGYGASPLL